MNNNNKYPQDLSFCFWNIPHGKVSGMSV